jgi:hypothetical protein
MFSVYEAYKIDTVFGNVMLVYIAYISVQVSSFKETNEHA